MSNKKSIIKRVLFLVVAILIVPALIGLPVLAESGVLPSIGENETNQNTCCSQISLRTTVGTHHVYMPDRSMCVRVVRTTTVRCMNCGTEVSKTTANFPSCGRIHPY